MTTKTTPAARPATITGFARPLSIRTAENIAACAAVGLSFWAEAPGPGMLWAVDAEQLPHTVRIDRKRGTAVAVCTSSHRFDPATQRPRSFPACTHSLTAAQWGINDHVAALFVTPDAKADETVTEVAQSDTAAHVISVAYQPKGAHGYPHRGHCTCGWASIGYAADHAARGVAEAHRDGELRAEAIRATELADDAAAQETVRAEVDAQIDRLTDKAIARAAADAEDVGLRAMTISVGGKSVVTDRARKQMLGRRVHAAVAAMLDGLTAEDFAEMGFTVAQRDEAVDFAKVTASKWVSYVPTDQK